MAFAYDTSDTVTFDHFDANSTAIFIFADDVEITIAPNFFIGSGTAIAVASGNARSALINNGNILSGGNAGVFFDGAESSITNNAGAIITGGIDGIRMEDGTLNNHGTVHGLQEQGVQCNPTPPGAGIALFNDGEIYGRVTGILVESSDGIINNSGLIDSDHFGVTVNSPGGIDIINLPGGTIRGTDAAINTLSTFSARLSLDNKGTIAGIIDCDATAGNVNDLIVNSGKITGQVRLGDGNDSFNGAAGATAVTVLGEAGDDTLFGSKAADTLNGGAGIDTIRGGLGKDSLFGGTERDIFDFNAIAESKKGASRDTIQDFVRGNNTTGDDIDLRTIDAKTGVSGNNAFKFIGKQDFHDQKGELRYEDKGSQVIVQGDVNGDGKADFEILVKVGALSSGDFLL